MTRRRLVSADRVEVIWVLRFWLARWRGRRTAKIAREMRAIERVMSFEGAHALHEASSP